MIYANALPDFPETADNGVAYIIDLSNKSAEEIGVQRDSVTKAPIYYKCITIMLLIHCR